MDKNKVSREERQIGARIKSVRKINNLTQEQMAERMGISSTTHYQNIENGRNNVGYKHLKCLKKEFGVSSDFILFGEVGDKKEFVFDFESLLAEEQVELLMKIIEHMCEDNSNTYSKVINKRLGDKKKGK